MKTHIFLCLVCKKDRFALAHYGLNERGAIAHAFQPANPYAKRAA